MREGLPTAIVKTRRTLPPVNEPLIKSADRKKSVAPDRDRSALPVLKDLQWYVRSRESQLFLNPLGIRLVEIEQDPLQGCRLPTALRQSFDNG